MPRNRSTKFRQQVRTLAVPPASPLRAGRSTVHNCVALILCCSTGSTRRPVFTGKRSSCRQAKAVRNSGKFSSFLIPWRKTHTKIFSTSSGYHGTIFKSLVGARSGSSALDEKARPACFLHLSIDKYMDPPVLIPACTCTSYACSLSSPSSPSLICILLLHLLHCSKQHCLHLLLK